MAYAIELFVRFMAFRRKTLGTKRCCSGLRTPVSALGPPNVIQGLPEPERGGLGLGLKVDNLGLGCAWKLV